MKMMINRQHSYLIADENSLTTELGSLIFTPGENKMHIVLTPGELTALSEPVNAVADLEGLVEAMTAGGELTVVQKIDAPTGFVITQDTTIVNNGELTVSEDTAGDGVFCVVDGTLTLAGKGTVNGLGNNPYSMAVWAKDNGKVVIKDGYFTNVGAYSENDGEHFDLIYASVNGQVEILGGEFQCETPRWTLNIKDKDRTTASIVVKGGKFHGFNPANCEVEGEGTNFVAPGYKVVETNGIFEVIPE